MRFGNMKNLAKNRVLILVILISLIFIVAYFRFFLLPMLSKFKTAFQEAGELKSRIRMARLAIEDMPNAQKEIDNLRQKAGSYGDKLPKEEEFPAILENLSQMARSTGVRITKILPVKNFPAGEGENAKADIYRQKQICIDAQCGYHQLGTFVAELENAERLMKVSNIQIEAGKADPKRHNIQLVVTIFMLKNE